MNRVLFQQDNIAGVALSIIGFEVDDRDIFEQQIEDFQQRILDFEDVYLQILASGWSAISGSLGTLGGLVAAALGLSNAWVAAIAAAVTLAINIFVALWAPADLIIEDAAGLTIIGLGALTSPNLPAPAADEFTTPGGIDVRIEPVSKSAAYVERRRYGSDAEDSEYHITLRYDRLS